MRTIELGQTTYFHFATNDTAGSGDDGASAQYDVRLAGATISDAPILSGSGSLVSHANYPDGCYEVAIAATAGNGFAEDEEYAVFATVAVDSQNPTGYVGSFYIRANVGSLTAHFTNEDTDGFSTVQTVSGEYILRITGTMAGASVKAFGGTVGQDVAEFTLLRTFTTVTQMKFTYAGDVRFELDESTGSTSVSVSLQEVATC
jgi:hypothetical protein